MQVFSAPHFPFGNALEVELYFCGKTFVFRAQTLASVKCQPKTKGSCKLRVDAGGED